MKYVRAIVVAVALLGMGTAYAQDYVTVERREGSAAGTVLRNTVTGGLVGSAVAGGIILYEMGIQDNDDYNWERTLAWGAVIGLGAGLIWGVVDATTGPSYSMIARTPVRDGQSMTLDVRKRDQSGKETFPVFGRRF